MKTSVTILITLFGYGLGMLVVFFEQLFWGMVVWQDYISLSTEPAPFFNEHPYFALWTFLIGVQFSLWFLLSAYSTLNLREIQNHFECSSGQVFFSILLSAGVFIFVFGINAFTVDRFMENPWPYEPLGFPLSNIKAKMSVVMLAGMIASSLGLSTLVLLALRANSANTALTYKNHTFLMQNREQMLFFLGMVVSAATLTTGALQVAIKNYYTDELFPAQLTYLFGLLATFMLAVVYVPSFNSGRNFAIRLKDKVIRGEQDAKFPTKEFFSLQSRLDEELHLTKNWTELLRNGIPLASPLLGSIIPSLLSG